MKEINIAQKLAAKRKEKGITQDELAAYIGVSKASVSKWETGQSYPDITFLPQLATYFNISIDELIGYEPQMTKEDITKLYNRLTGEFSRRTFDEVIAECREIVKKYYSCFPLLFQMAALYINHYMLAKDKDTQETIIKEAADLCRRIKAEYDDVWLINQANSLEAVCCLMLQQPTEVLDLLEGITKPSSSDETILASAYQMTGNMEKAKEVLQIGIYRHLLDMMNIAPSYLILYQNEPEKFEEILNRFLPIAGIFHLDRLHFNTMLRFYLISAQGYTAQENNEKALDMIQKYADLCLADDFKISLHGDAFFDRIDSWFDEFELGVQLPRDESVISKSIIQAVEENPAFGGLQSLPRFKSIVDKLKAKLGGK